MVSIRLCTKNTWPPRRSSRCTASRIRSSDTRATCVRTAMRSTGGVWITDRSRMPENASWSVRGIGVAVSVSTSTSLRSCFSRSLCATPKRCSSSTITRPRLRNATSFESSRWVPMTTSSLPAASPSRTSFTCLGDDSRESAPIEIGVCAKRSRSVSRCCWHSTVVGTRNATCFPPATAR